MKTIKKLVTVISLTAWSPQLLYATASPSLNNHCTYSLNTPQNGTGVLFDESCQVAYVLPPKSGRAEIGALAPSSNLQFCEAVNNVKATAENSFKSMNILSQKVVNMIADFEPLEQDVLELEKEASSAKVKMESAQHQLKEAENKISLMREDTRKARKSYEECVEDFSSSHALCLELKKSWDQEKEEINKFRTGEYRNINNKADDTKEDLDIKLGQLKIHKERYIEAIAPIVDLQDRISSLNLKVMELYREYTKLEGATGIITWSVPWDTLLKDYKDANQNIPVQWAQLPIKEAQLVSTVKTESENSESITSLKSARIIGAKPTGFAGMGTGKAVAGAQTTASVPSSETSLLFSNSISGQIVLTLAGACPYVATMNDGSYKDISGLTSHMLANLVYTYEVAARRSYTARYNLSELLKKIEVKTKRGGFFSTSDAHHVLNENYASDWFSIKFDANTSEFNYTEPEQKALTKTIKKELMDKAYAEFAVLHSGQASPSPIPDFTESGAHRASEEFRKCWHLYCQISSAVIGVANSIWGNSTAVANFHRNNNVWTTEHVNGIQFVTRSGSLTFKAE